MDIRGNFQQLTLMRLLVSTQLKTSDVVLFHVLQHYWFCLYSNSNSPMRPTFGRNGHRESNWINLNQNKFLIHLYSFIFSYLVSINKYYFIYSQREKNIQKKDFVAPDNSLLFCLLIKPARPFILY